MVPIPFMEVYDVETCMWNMGKEKGFVYCCQFLGLKIFVYEKVFQNKLNVKKCEIIVLYRALCILLTIVQRLYKH
jgi:hypothetical protein